MHRFSTEELIFHYKYYVHELVDLINKGEEVHNVASYLPFVVHLNSPIDLSLSYVNPRFTSVIGYSLEELVIGGSEIFTEYVHPDSLALYPTLLDLTHQAYGNDFTFLHHIRMSAPKPNFRPLITITKSVDRFDGLLFCLSAEPKQFGQWRNKILNVIELDQFKLKNFELFRLLTKREIELIKALANGHSNSDIAERLFISRSTVETHRKRLKAKLGISSYRDLLKFAVAFGLVDT